MTTSNAKTSPDDVFDALADLCDTHPAPASYIPYVVNGDANDLEGWTAESLAAAITAPLAALGVTVECRPRESGLGGFYLWNRDSGPGRHLAAEAEAIVERIIQAGPAA